MIKYPCRPLGGDGAGSGVTWEWPMPGLSGWRIREKVSVRAWRRLLTPFGIAVLYFLVGTAWILYSDDLVAAVPDRAMASQLQSVKGLAFIGGTAVLLLILIGRLRREIVRSAHAREQQREARGHLTATLAHLSPGPTPEAAAGAICASLRSLPSVEVAALLATGREGATVLAIDGEGQQFPPAGSSVPARVMKRLAGRSMDDAWRSDTPLDPAVRGWLGVDARGLIGVPILDGPRLRAVLLAFTTSPGRLHDVANQLPSAVDLAGVAEALIVPPLRAREAAGRRRAVLASVIEHRRFRIVFQPIVDLATGRVVGYEALTRFADGTNPKERFVEAAELGVSAELEAASLSAAVAAAEVLPHRAWLSLNVSPALLLHSSLPPLLRNVQRPLVLELTEHEPIGDYAAIRVALRSIGRTARLAVDDAGAGFASLRHLAELRPSIVKLDRDLIAGVATDQARQALIAGLRHYADRSRCILVAEGVETDAERRAVLELGVDLGQGYLFGPPSPTGATGAPDSGTQPHATEPASERPRRLRPRRRPGSLGTSAA